MQIAFILSIYHFSGIHVFNVIYLFLERGGGREKNIYVKSIGWLPLIRTPNEYRTCNPGMCPDRELNQLPLTWQDDAQPTEPHWSGLEYTFQKMRKSSHWIVFFSRQLHIFLFAHILFPLLQTKCLWLITWLHLSRSRRSLTAHLGHGSYWGD